MPSMSPHDGPSIAVLLPCRNQAGTVGAVVRGFAEALPGARVYVFDNNSTDDTARAASLAGARVFRERRRGKANVVRRMFADIEADIYVMAEADGTYDPSDAPSLVNALVTEHVDMVVGTNRPAGVAPRAAARRVERLCSRAAGGRLSDLFSGYRAFTRRFVKSFPALPTGFPIETEMSIHASQLMIPVAEIDLGNGVAASPARARGRTGAEVAGMLASLTRHMRPFFFYSLCAVPFWILGLVLALRNMSGDEAAGPSILAMTLLLVGLLLAGLGLVLDKLAQARIEQKRILFLTAPALRLQ